MSIQLITNDKIKRYDSKPKIYLLIFIAGFCNFIYYFIFLRINDNMDFYSSSLDKRI